jgi:hypothetical protein
MNERYLELAAASGAYCESLLGGDYKPPELNGMDIEKFAKLIIRECVKHLENECLYDAAYELCKHFI